MTATASGGNEDLMSKLGAGVGNLVKSYLVKEARPGGVLWNVKNGRA